MVAVRWNDYLSSFVSLMSGVRQGGILSPVLFSIYMDGLIKKLRDSRCGCVVRDVYVGCLLYADDIMLVSYSVSIMQKMLKMCDVFASEFDIKFNSQKSIVLRIGSRFKAKCAVLMLGNESLRYGDTCKYLGVQIEAGVVFSCSFNNIRHKFYKMFNCIYSKTKSANSELVTIHLVNAYCMPSLMYCIEVIPLKRKDMLSLNRCVNCVISKVFALHDQNNISMVRQLLGMHNVEDIVRMRCCSFLSSIIGSDEMYKLSSASILGRAL
jgi:hypothetical protein